MNHTKPKIEELSDKNRGGYMHKDRKSKTFIACKDEFNECETSFMINAINRRSKYKFDVHEINEMCVNWLYFFLMDIEDDFGEAGQTLNLCTRIKLFHHLQNVKRDI